MMVAQARYSYDKFDMPELKLTHYKNGLARRPGHVSSAQHMEMKVKHALAAMRAGIDDKTVPGIGNPLQFRNLVAGQHQMPK
jgi:hypothetical protein